MTPARESEIRVALADGHILTGTAGDWQDFAGELLDALDAARAGFAAIQTVVGVLADAQRHPQLFGTQQEIAEAVADALRRHAQSRT